MPSNNKNIIGKLRRRYEPHMQLSAKVDLNHTIIHEVEKKLSDLPKIHKTLSKSFAMQRKTLVKVLGLEKRVNVLELEQAAEEQAQEGIDEILSDLGEEAQEGDVIIPEVLQDDAEVGGDDEGSPSSVRVLDGEKKPPFKVNRRIIKVEDLKRGTSQESLENIRPDKSQNPDITPFFGDPRPDVTSDAITPEVLPPEEEVKSPVGEGLKNILNSIAETTESIKNVLIGQQKADNEAAKDAAKDAEDSAMAGQEKKLETKLFDGVKKVGEKVLKPVQGLFERIWGFVKKVLLADIVRRLFNWLSDEGNKKKVGSIFRFVKDFWPALLTGFLLFGTGIGSLITGTIGALASFVPTLVGMLPGLLAFLASPIGLAVLGTAAVVGGGMWVANKMKGDDDKDKKIEGSDDKTQKLNKGGLVQNFNAGGSVPGQGNTDTVPAMLTPGEFVLTKEATEKYGTDTLESMNAAAATGKKETSGIGRGIGSAVGGLAGGVVGFFADSPVSPVADIALGIAGSTAGGEIGDNVERKVRGMNKGGVVQYFKDGGQAKENKSKPKPEDFGLSKDFNYDDPKHREEFVKVIGPHLKTFMEQQNKAVDENPDAYNGVKLTLDRDGRMPNFGEFVANQSEVAFNQSLAMVQSNESIPGEARSALSKKMLLFRQELANNPNWKGDMAFDINKDIPGTAAYRILMAEEKKRKQPKVATWREMEGEESPFSAAEIAALKNRHEKSKSGKNFNRGGLVQHFNRGGLVEEWKALKMKRDRIKPGPNGKFSRADSKRWKQLSSQMRQVKKQMREYDNTSGQNQRLIPKKSEKNPANFLQPQGFDSNDKSSKKAKGLGLGRMLGGAADFLTGNLTDFDGKGGKTFGASRVLAGAADALTGNRWDFDKHGKPAQVAKSKPKHTEIAPPSTSSRGSSSKPGVTAINAGGTGPTIDATNDTPIPEVPVFSAFAMRSPDKIKTLGIMV